MIGVIHFPKLEISNVTRHCKYSFCRQGRKHDRDDVCRPLLCPCEEVCSIFFFCLNNGILRNSHTHFLLVFLLNVLNKIEKTERFVFDFKAKTSKSNVNRMSHCWILERVYLTVCLILIYQRTKFCM